jgi:hypothetical protein
MSGVTFRVLLLWDWVWRRFTDGYCSVRDGDNKGDGAVAVVREADRPGSPTENVRPFQRRAVEMEAGGTVVCAHYLNVRPCDAITPYTCAEGLGRGFFGGKARRQRFIALIALGNFARSIDPREEAVLMANDGCPNAGNFYEVYTRVEHEALNTLYLL